MKTPGISRLAGLLTAGALTLAGRAAAADFGFLAQSSPAGALVVSNSVLYTINLTNTSGSTLGPIRVTNRLSAAVGLIGATNDLFSLNPAANPITTLSDGVLFQIDSLTDGEAAHLTLDVTPLGPGQLTNTITVAVANAVAIETNVVNAVLAAQADLAVSVAGLPSSAVVDDYVTFGVNVTNLGPDTVPNVLLNTYVSSPWNPIGVSPTNQVNTLTNGVWLFSLGTMTNGAFRNLRLTVQPTVAGTSTLAVVVGAGGILDTNGANDAATNSFIVQPILAGQLTVSIVATQHYNPQTGLMEQTVRLTNTGTNNVDSARVIVSGLTNQVLYNAAGTNSGDPFVVYAAPLGTNQSVNLVLEYFVSTRLPVPMTDSQFRAVEVLAANIVAPQGAAPAITNLASLGPGRLLIEFQSVPGRSYTVLYSDNFAFTNALAAQPAIVAPADRVQWIDDGPPKTVSPPTNGLRFYRVLLNP